MGANVVAWINWQLDPAFMAHHFMTSLHHIREGRWYTIVTTCFSHRDPIHLLGNMVTLYFFWNRVFSGRLVTHSATGFKEILILQIQQGFQERSPYRALMLA